MSSFLGEVDEAQLGNVYARCRALLFAADEDFGMVPLEAQSYGRPVIAFGKGGSLETVIGTYNPIREKQIGRRYWVYWRLFPRANRRFAGECNSFIRVLRGDIRYRSVSSRMPAGLTPRFFLIGCATT